MRRVHKTEGFHICTKCGVLKPLTQFYLAGPMQGGTGRSSQCRRCQLDRARLRRFKEYGLTEETYARMLSEQNGLCAICKDPARANHIAALHVDHCHETGHVRALLCKTCNLALGYLLENHSIAYEAAKYLHMWTAKRLAGVVKPRKTA